MASLLPLLRGALTRSSEQVRSVWYYIYRDSVRAAHSIAVVSHITRERVFVLVPRRVSDSVEMTACRLAVQGAAFFTCKLTYLMLRLFLQWVARD
jgi:hypothetical protein